MSHVKYDERFSEKLNRKQKPTADFSKVGGLSNHIRILRDSIIAPLLHHNVYQHFNIKTPRGVLFYGPPGTGKTLVAGALATELSKEGFAKVSFFQRKGADVLDKWLGESEKKLRTLFENATKSRPSIIFFDELDGLAPIRSAKNDHVHCSIVTTLLSLMDGLDSVPGVIVIGATNRIESLDPALRRPGRFDKELYFPLPSTEARKEILQVHMQSWRHKPSPQFVSQLAEMTTGFCGSDLQALCSEAVLCAMKRSCPNMQKCLLGSRIKIEAGEIKIDECDFLNATKNLTPTAHKLGNPMRKLNNTVAPLLQRQLSMVLSHVQMLWPHFFMQFHKYLPGSEKYIGRIVLMGSNMQGLNTHLIPAILQHFEHLPALFLNASTLQNRSLLPNFCKNLPAILVIPRVDDLWNFLDILEQNIVASILEELHSGLPILIIATCEEELPIMLQNFFYNNTTMMMSIENPTEQEVENFFVPLFFGESSLSLSTVLSNNKRSSEKKSCDTLEAPNKKTKLPRSSTKVYKLKPTGKITKARSSTTLKKTLRVTPDKDLGNYDGCSELVTVESLCTLCGTAEKKKRLSIILTELLQKSIQLRMRKKSPNEKTSTSSHSNSGINLVQSYGDSNDVDRQQIFNLWRRVVVRTAKDMPLAHLEVLHDTISACIRIHKDNFQNLIQNLEETLDEIESTR